MQGGTLKHRIQFQQRPAGRDAAGQPLAWANVGNPVWADVEPQSGGQTIKGGAETSIVRTLITIRYRADVSAALRIVHGADIYKVLSVHQDMAKRQYTELVCQISDAAL